jgi:hypothetical protein
MQNLCPQKLPVFEKKENMPRSADPGAATAE